MVNHLGGDIFYLIFPVKRDMNKRLEYQNPEETDPS